MLLQIRSTLPAGATFVTRDIINKLDINVNKSKVLGPVFFLPPLPWSGDLASSLLTIHKSLMPKGCGASSIESRVFLSFIRNRARLLQIQSYLIKNLYCQINKLADDSDSCLKQKNKYKVVILNLIFPCMSGWQGSFFGNDFLNYLQRRFLLTEPGSQKVIDGTNIFGSRLESAFIKYLFSLKNSPDFDKAQVRQSNEAFQVFYDSYKLMRAQEKTVYL